MNQTNSIKFFENAILHTWPGRRKDQELVLLRLSRCFTAGQSYSEPQVNQILKNHIRIRDHVFFRRELVDLDLLQRTNTGSEYMRQACRDSIWISRALSICVRDGKQMVTTLENVLSIPLDTDLQWLEQFRTPCAADETEVQNALKVGLLEEVFPDDICENINSLPATQTSEGLRVGPARFGPIGCPKCLDQMDKDSGRKTLPISDNDLTLIKQLEFFVVNKDPEKILIFDQSSSSVQWSSFYPFLNGKCCSQKTDSRLPMHIEGELQKNKYLKFSSERAPLDTSIVVGPYSIISFISKTEPVFNSFVSHAKMNVRNFGDETEPYSAGKGSCDSMAISGAIGEEIERYLAGLKSGIKTEIASFNSLKKGQAVDPCRFCLPVTKQTGGLIDYTPDLEIEWIKGYNLRENKKVLIPANLVFYPYRSKFPTISHQATTGLAAGSSLIESIFYSLLEVIERDAYWFFMRTQVQSPDWEVKSTDLLSTIKMLSEQGIVVHLKDFTTDFNVPVVHALIESKTENGGPKYSRGSGSHLWDGDQAALKAINEAMQIRLDQILHKQHYGLNNKKDPHERWFNCSADTEVAHLKLSGHSRQVSENHIMDENTSYGSLLEKLLTKILNLGKEAYIVNLSRPGVPLRTVRALITGVGLLDPTFHSSSLRLKEIGSWLGVTSDLSVKYGGEIFD